MLAQFQARYPTGSLISELLTIYQGKFIVRVSAQIEGVTRATGMAAAETLELAEDQARNRALAVLVIDQAPPTLPETASNQLSSSTIPEQPIPTTAFSPEAVMPAKPSLSFAATTELKEPLDSPFSQETLPLEESIPALGVSSGFPGKSDDYEIGSMSLGEQEPIPNADTFSKQETEKPIDFQSFPMAATVPNQEEASGENPHSDHPPISFSNVTPLVPDSHNSQASAVSEPETRETIVSEPIDLSDAIARTNVELKRLGWSNKQGREYLERKYHKRSRQHLSDEEMLEFLHDLESLPTP